MNDFKEKLKNYTSPRIFVAHWFESKGYSARAAMTNPNLFGSMFLDYSEVAGTLKYYKMNVFNKELLNYAFEGYVDANLKADLPHSIDGLEHIPGMATDPVADWTKAVTGRADSKDVAIVKHWMWMIKRKALGLSVKYQIMPVILGAQQGGKSTAIKALVKPLEKFLLLLQFDKLSDERTYHGYSYNLIVFIDEMQGIERADLNALKNQITTDTNSYRRLYTHAVVNVPMACSFIGATNRHLNEMLFDSTGMRRFYQLEALPQLDWKVINELSYAGAWQSIDENSEDGYLTGEILEEVNSKQKSLVVEDDLECYIQQRNLRPSVGNRMISGKDLFTDYTDWAFQTRQNVKWNQQNFVRRLKNRGLEWAVVKHICYFKVNAACDVKELSGTPKLEVVNAD